MIAPARRSWCAVRGLLAALWLAAALPVIAAAAEPGKASGAGEGDMDVHVTRADKTVIVHVSFLVDVTPDLAWSVLVDYGNMTKFISNLESSAILSRNGDTLEVAQKGKVSQGLLQIGFDNVREVVLTPKREIRSRLIRGDMQSSNFITRVVAEGERTRVSNDGEFVPNAWLPPGLGTTLAESQTRKQWQEMRAEMLRRAQAASAAK